MADFFISYNKADRKWAEWIAWQLEEAGYTSIIQAWDFKAGGNFILEMDKATKEAERTIAVLSEDYLKALYTQPEWAAAFKQDPTGEKGLLIPVRVQECTLSGLLAAVVYIDLVGLEEETAENDLLARIVQILTGERGKPQTEPAFPGSASHSLPEKPQFPGGPNSVEKSPHLDWARPPIQPSCTITTDRGMMASGKKLDALIQSYRQRIDGKPNDLNTLYHLGLALRKKGEVGEAIEIFRRTVENAPTDEDPADNSLGYDFASRAWMSLGVTLRNQNRLDEAITAFRRATSLQPRSKSVRHDIHLNLASALFDVGNLGEAIESYRLATAADEKKPAAHSGLAWALWTGGQHIEAVLEFQKAMELEPDNVYRHLEFGNALRQTGRSREAKEVLTRAGEMEPDWPELRYGLAYAHLDAGELDDAVASFTAATELAPDWPDVLNGLGEVLWALGKSDEALRTFRAAVEAAPESGLTHFNLGRALLESGKSQEAINAFRKTLELRDDWAEAYFGLSIALREAGKADDAQRALAEAERIGLSIHRQEPNGR